MDTPLTLARAPASSLTNAPVPAHAVALHWRNSFAAMDPAFFTRLSPTSLPSPYWVGQSLAVAHELIHALQDQKTSLGERFGQVGGEERNALIAVTEGQAVWVTD